MSRLFIDNDVLIKAAHWCLLEELPASVGTTWEQTSAIASLAFRARRKDRKLFQTSEAASALEACLARTLELPAPDVTVVAALQNATAIDVGEVALIGALCACPDSLLITGDKRALRALAEPAFEYLHTRVRGRIRCLEQFLMYVADTHGVPALIDRIGPYGHLDTAVRCVVGTSANPEDASIREGLDSYVHDLRRDCRSIFLPLCP